MLGHIKLNDQTYRLFHVGYTVDHHEATIINVSFHVSSRFINWQVVIQKTKSPHPFSIGLYLQMTKVHYTKIRHQPLFFNNCLTLFIIYAIYLIYQSTKIVLQIYVEEKIIKNVQVCNHLFYRTFNSVQMRRVCRQCFVKMLITLDQK